MLAATLLDPLLPVLKPTDTVARTLQWMEEYRSPQLIVADEDRYLGLVSEAVLFDVPDDSLPLSELPMQCSEVYATTEQHLYELLRLASLHQLDLVPVLDQDKKLEGGIPTRALLTHFSELLGIPEPGAVVVLNMAERDYSLTEISRHTEANGVKIRSSYYSIPPVGSNKEPSLTLKLNRTDIMSLVATFERFGYDIQSVHASDPILSSDQERLDMLMRYLAT